MRILLLAVAGATMVTVPFVLHADGNDPVFSGAAGWQVVPGSTSVTTTDVAVGAAFAEQGVRYARTGVWRQELVTGGAFTKHRIRAGSPVYAVKADGENVGWCTPGSVVRDASGRVTKRNRERCIFRDARIGVYETVAFDSNSAHASRILTGRSVVKGEPLVDETPSSSSRSFRLLARLEKLTADRAEIGFSFHDGVDGTQLLRKDVRRNGDGSFDVELWHGKVRLVPAADGRFGVVTVTALQDRLSPIAALSGARYSSHASRVIIY